MIAHIDLYARVEATFQVNDEEVIEPILDDDHPHKICNCKTKKPKEGIDMENRYAKEASKALSDAFIAHSKKDSDTNFKTSIMKESNEDDTTSILSKLNSNK